MRCIVMAFSLVAAAWLCCAQTEAATVTCPPPAPGGAFRSDEGGWSQPYEGPLTSVEMRSETAGARRGEATIFCARARGAVRLEGKHCRITPAAGGRISTVNEGTAEVVTCTLLGSSGTNDTACFVVCD